jgi:hypothetical protein
MDWPHRDSRNADKVHATFSPPSHPNKIALTGSGRFAIRTVRRQSPRHGVQLIPDAAQLFDLVVQFLGSLPDQGLSVTAWAQPSICDLQQLADVAQPQANTLGALDKSDTVDFCWPI